MNSIPSTRDNGERVGMLVGQPITVRRIALNMDQIDRYGPPPNPAKITDTRAKGYIGKFGHQSWELDALEPAVIGALVSQEIERHVDRMEWLKAQEAEQENRAHLAKLHRHWPAVLKQLEALP